MIIFDIEELKKAEAREDDIICVYRLIFQKEIIAKNTANFSNFGIEYLKRRFCSGLGGILYVTKEEEIEVAKAILKFE